MLWQDVCLSVTHRYSVKTAKHIVKLFYHQEGTPNVMAVFRRGPPNGGV